MKHIEQELADLIHQFVCDKPWTELELSKAILASGLVIPVSILDGMVEKLAEAIQNEYDIYLPSMHLKFASQLAQAAINKVKEEARK